MKKTTRRILTLALVVALTSILAVTVLAHNTYTNEDEFNGGTVIEYAYINRTRLYGDITVEDDSGMGDDYFRQVTMELWYIAEDDNGLPETYKWPTTISASGSGPNVNASKNISEATVHGRAFVCLSYANYSCAADVVGGTTVQRYTHGPAYFSYMMQ